MLLLTAAGSKGRRVRTGMPYLLCFSFDNIPAVFPFVKGFFHILLRLFPEYALSLRKGCSLPLPPSLGRGGSGSAEDLTSLRRCGITPGLFARGAGRLSPACLGAQKRPPPARRSSRSVLPSRRGSLHKAPAPPPSLPARPASWPDWP